MFAKSTGFVFLCVLGVTLLTGCRSDKSSFSYSPPQPSTTLLADTEQQSNAAPTQPGEQEQTLIAQASNSSAAYVSPSDYSSKSNAYSGCSSGCCSR